MTFGVDWALTIKQVFNQSYIISSCKGDVTVRHVSQIVRLTWYTRHSEEEREEFPEEKARHLQVQAKIDLAKKTEKIRGGLFHCQLTVSGQSKVGWAKS